jgi:hypothetical protein
MFLNFTTDPWKTKAKYQIKGNEKGAFVTAKTSVDSKSDDSS